MLIGTCFSGSGEFQPSEDMALAVRKITTAASQRIARAAFELASRRDKHVTMVHKANVLKVTDGLFIREVVKVADEFPDVRLDEMLVDAMAAGLIRNPEAFDVIVTSNMYGDILSDEAAALCGGLGLASALNAGDEHAIAQAVHGSAPDIAGRGIANPSALMLSAAMLLDWLAARHDRPILAVASDLLEGCRQRNPGRRRESYPGSRRQGHDTIVRGGRGGSHSIPVRFPRENAAMTAC